MYSKIYELRDKVGIPNLPFEMSKNKPQTSYLYILEFSGS